MEAILIYLLKSAGVLAIFFFSYQFFLKKETFFRMNRHYLLAGILGSLLLPLVIFTNYVYVEPVIETFNPNLFLTDIPFTNNAVEQNKPFNWLLFGTYVYLAGVLIFGMNFVIQLISLFNLFKNNTKKREDGFYFVELNSNISPFSFFNYIVYNPKKYNRNDLEIIINHEKAHG
ncbi:MAG: M56 family peptidase, partial [Bacteroidia bacterium]|nr:M56 family peptidase [Bacteroidia bacterium]